MKIQLIRITTIIDISKIRLVVIFCIRLLSESLIVILFYKVDFHCQRKDKIISVSKFCVNVTLNNAHNQRGITKYENAMKIVQFFYDPSLIYQL